MRKFLLLFCALLLGASGAFAQTYLEEPARKNSGLYVTTLLPVGEGSGRSFTYRYDADRRVALWVAYPLNASLIGEGSRGDGWVPDPSIPESIQASLYKGFRYGSGYDRGHQIPSADRLSPKANAQTFRFTNATPQLHDFNGGIWAELEKRVRVWAKHSDTLYVVTGIIPGNSTIPDNDGNAVNIPSAYYKTVLRLSSDSKGRKHWSVCSVLLPHENVTVGTWKDNNAFFRQCALPMAELERQTGERFFPLMYGRIDTREWYDLMNANPADCEWWWK